MTTVILIVLGVIVLGALFGGKGRGRSTSGGPVRIEHPHVIDPDDYECSVCRRRFRKNQAACPYCGARFTGRTVNHEEFDEEEEELEAWDEEDGI